MPDKSLRIAVQGCCHGELNAVYAAIAHAERQNNYKIDLLIVGGDFQSIRNLSDLSCMAVPAKFRRLGDFAEYYAGTKKAPILTLFVGGNHEASNYLQELYHGGWVAPNIYYLGAANVVHFKGLRIGGISGIWSKHDYVRGHMEVIPYDSNTLRSVYHVRQYEVRKLMAYQQTKIDVFLSHDWPRGVEQHGNTGKLLRAKPFFKEEVMRNDLGSPANEELLRSLKPRYWFSAHLHVRFEALIDHSNPGDKRHRNESRSPKGPTRKIIVDRDQPNPVSKNPDEIVLDLEDDAQNPDEIVLDVDESHQPIPTVNPDEIVVSLDDSGGVDLSTSNICKETPFSSAEVPANELTLEEYKLSVLKRNGLDLVKDSPSDTSSFPKENQTQFLALDKCLPRRHFLEIVNIPTSIQKIEDIDSSKSLKYDPEWLAITRTFAPFYSSSGYQKRLPNLDEKLKEDRAWISEHVKDLSIPFNFEHTAPIQDQTITERTKPILYRNPQTVAFSKMLDIPLK